MTRIHPIEPQAADNDTRTTLEAVRRKFGMLPNLIATLAHSPAALGGYLALSDSLAAGRLSARERELVALAVAQYNACAYCLSAHTALAAGAGLSEPEIAQARAGRAANPRDDALLTFVSSVLDSQGAVLGVELEAVREAGFDDAQVVEIVAHVAMNVLTNYLNNVARTAVDFPPVDVELAA